MTPLPVLGVGPIEALSGMDSLLSIVQNPESPVGTLAIGAQERSLSTDGSFILALNDTELADRLDIGHDKPQTLTPYQPTHEKHYTNGAGLSHGILGGG